MTPTQHKILRYIWMKKQTTIRDISQNLRIDSSTVSRNLKSLIDDGLVMISGELNPSSSGGRKTKLFSLNHLKYLILGLGIEQSELSMVLLDLNGDIAEKSYDLVNMKKEEIVSAICEKVKKYESLFNKILGISIAMPGIIDTRKGEIIYCAALGLKNFPLLGKLREKFDFNYQIMNDANAASAAFSNRWRNLVYFLISIPFDLRRPVGIGAGIWLNGRNFLGSNMSAGEFELGALPPLFGDRKVRLTLKGFKRRKQLKLDEISSFLESLISYLTTSIYLLDPEGVVIGGDINLFPKSIHRILIERIKKRIDKRPISKTEIIIDDSGIESIAIGSAKAFLNRFMNEYDFAIKLLKGR